MSSLAEIVAEGKRLQEEYAADECASTWDAIVEHRNRIFPRLLAVAEAAVEKDAAHKAWSDGFAMRHPPPLSVVIAADERRKAANAAFDAAVRGEGKEKEG